MSANSQPRTALVTGASGGLGRRIVDQLVAARWHVIAAVRSEQALSDLPRGSVTPVTLDVTDPDSVSGAVTEISPLIAEHGLNALVNNAGVIVQGPVELVRPEELRRQFEINVVGQIAVTQALLPALRLAGGRVVNVGAITARVSVPFFGPVAASKAALALLNDALRMELRYQGVRVSLVEPGALETAIFDKADQAAAEAGWRGGPEAESCYRQALADGRAAAAKQSRTPADKAAATVVKAVTARRPATRYRVGSDARALAILRRLPDRLRDSILMSSVGLKKSSFPSEAALNSR
ncbi:SDR family NAD(P)-dependent oxidoreductase [Streptomyces triticirhizae]|uniref:SDR family NAD(P)-dependent oxidoreductase n=1 Tax=Streptomyces triticirhizae TaxID=2483353 RepID=A0A3M2LX37_9ACTN|nr:SDR family NAD(P)-dependent oxidoreductase [Streptomyces triticirhizae]RMI41123.1 SDR family NAD(P)-dependent oxidoreductase [Streptomyces triticirhizae]